MILTIQRAYAQSSQETNVELVDREASYQGLDGNSREFLSFGHQK